MNVLSLFDGISCARVALERCGFQVDKYYASEIDKYAIQVAQKNYPDTIQLGDVCKITKEMVGDIDLLIGGSPCQDLSIAKKGREGLSGSRSGLFWEYVRILKEVQPKWFVLENVNSMPKEAKQVITEAMGVEPIMINAALVSAQNRKRLFWTNIPNVTLPEDRGILLKDILEDGVGVEVKNQGKTCGKELTKSLTIMTRDYKGFGNQAMTGVQRIGQIGENFYVYNKYNNRKMTEKCGTIGTSMGRTAKQGYQLIRVGQIGKGGQGDRIYSPDGKSVNLSANGALAASQTQSKTGVALRNRGEGKKPEYNGTEKANAMTSVQTDSMVLDNTIIRKLTPIECERLQSLSDDYTEGLSNTQRYKCCGNAFNVEVVRHILSFIK